MYEALETSDQVKADSARADLKEALHLAKELDIGAPLDKRSEPRNLTYLLLWHALNRPEQAGDLYIESLRLAHESRHGDGYVQRAAHLARYRALLSGGDPKLSWWPTEEPPIPDTAFADGWPAATALKYSGACRAAFGDFEGAKSDFDEASEILRRANGWLLAFIRGTILLQAGESLMASNPDAAAEFMRESAALFETIHGFGLINRESAVAPDRWLLRARHVLDRGSSPQTNPQLFYQY